MFKTIWTLSNFLNFYGLTTINSKSELCHTHINAGARPLVQYRLHLINLLLTMACPIIGQSSEGVQTWIVVYNNNKLLLNTISLGLLIPINHSHWLGCGSSKYSFKNQLVERNCRAQGTWVWRKLLAVYTFYAFETFFHLNF